MIQAAGCTARGDGDARHINTSATNAREVCADPCDVDVKARKKLKTAVSPVYFMIARAVEQAQLMLVPCVAHTDRGWRRLKVGA